MKRNEIWRSYGTEHKEMTERLLAACDLKELIFAKCGAASFDARIGIKPNLVCPTPASYGATTHPEIVSGILSYLKGAGFNNLYILEGSWVGDKTSEAFEYCGYRALSEEYSVPLIDTQKDPVVSCDCNGMKIQICKSVFEADFLINVPVLKGHCQTKITCALKNMKGIIPNTEKRRFHTIGLHQPIASLNTQIHQDFIVIDHICGDPYFEEGGSPLTKNCIMTALDPVLTDAYVCSLLGFETSEVEYITLAEAAGVGCADLSQLKLITLEGDASDDTPLSRRIMEIDYAVDQSDSCSACYAMLTEALERLQSEGLLENLKDKICIGQGYKGKTGRLGVGACTGKFEYSIPGCPPDAEAIYTYLKNYITSEK